MVRNAVRLQAILSAFTATRVKRKKYLLSFPQGFAEKMIRGLHQRRLNFTSSTFKTNEGLEAFDI